MMKRKRCLRCKGKGWIFQVDDDGEGSRLCPKCLGTGKLLIGGFEERDFHLDLEMVNELTREGFLIRED